LVLGLFERPVFEHTTVPSVVKGADADRGRIRSNQGKGQQRNDPRKFNFRYCPSFRCGIYSCRISPTAIHFASRRPSSLGVRLLKFDTESRKSKCQSGDDISRLFEEYSPHSTIPSGQILLDYRERDMNVYDKGNGGQVHGSFCREHPYTDRGLLAFSSESQHSRYVSGDTAIMHQGHHEHYHRFDGTLAFLSMSILISSL